MESELKSLLDQWEPRRFSEQEIDLLKQMYARVVEMQSDFRELREDIKLQKSESNPLEVVVSLEPVMYLQVSVASGKGNAPEGVVVEEKLNLPLRNMVEHLVCPKEEVSLMYFSKENPTKELQVNDFGLVKRTHDRLEPLDTMIQNGENRMMHEGRFSQTLLARRNLGVRKITVKRRYHKARKKKSTSRPDYVQTFRSYGMFCCLGFKDRSMKRKVERAHFKGTTLRLKVQGESKDGNRFTKSTRAENVVYVIKVEPGSTSSMENEDPNPDYGYGFMQMAIPFDSPEISNFQFVSEASEKLQIGDTLKDESYDSLADSMLCDPNSSLVHTGFTRADRTNDTTLFINAGEVDSKMLLLIKQPLEEPQRTWFKSWWDPICDAFELYVSAARVGRNRNKYTLPQSVAMVNGIYLRVDASEKQTINLSLVCCAWDPGGTRLEIANWEKVASGMFCVLATLSVVPVIRCPRGGSAESLLDQKLRYHLLSKNNLFAEGGTFMSSFQSLLLCNFDRDFELSDGINHGFSYNTLVHGVLGVKLKRLNRQGVKGGMKSFELDSSDLFWSVNSSLEFSKDAVEIETQLNKYEEDHKLMYWKNFVLMELVSKRWKLLTPPLHVPELSRLKISSPEGNFEEQLQDKGNKQGEASLEDIHVICFEVGVCKHQRVRTKMKQNRRNCQGDSLWEFLKRQEAGLSALQEAIVVSDIMGHYEKCLDLIYIFEMFHSLRPPEQRSGKVGSSLIMSTKILFSCWDVWKKLIQWEEIHLLGNMLCVIGAYMDLVHWSSEIQKLMIMSCLEVHMISLFKEHQTYYKVKMNARVLWTKLTWITCSGDNKTVEATTVMQNSKTSQEGCLLLFFKRVESDFKIKNLLNSVELLDLMELSWLVRSSHSWFLKGDAKIMGLCKTTELVNDLSYVVERGLIPIMRTEYTAREARLVELTSKQLENPLFTFFTYIWSHSPRPPELFPCIVSSTGGMQPNLLEIIIYEIIWRNGDCAGVWENERSYFSATDSLDVDIEDLKSTLKLNGVDILAGKYTDMLVPLYSDYIQAAQPTLPLSIIIPLLMLEGLLWNNITVCAEALCIVLRVDSLKPYEIKVGNMFKVAVLMEERHYRTLESCASHVNVVVTSRAGQKLTVEDAHFQFLPP